MEAESHSRTPNFGLRDFLFYLIPGGVILASLVPIVHPDPSLMKDWGGLGGAIGGIFLAYFFGQVAYPITYAIRWLGFPKRFPSEDDQQFATRHFHLIEQHSVFYNTVVFRDRSFARFSLAMVFPTALFGTLVGIKAWVTGHWMIGPAIVAIGLLAALGFCHRYAHYEHRYRTEVQRADDLLMKTQHERATEGAARDIDDQAIHRTA